MNKLQIFFRKYPPHFIMAATMLAFFLVVCFLPTPHDFDQQNLHNRFAPPVFVSGTNFEHPFGTDHLGRDILSRTMSGIRISFFIAFLGTFTGAVIGTFLGYQAARFGGIVDSIIVMLIDIQASLPFMLVAIALLSIINSSFLVIVILLGIAGWEKYARLTRGLTMSAMKHGYALALHALGAGKSRIFFAHILPNIAGALLVNMTLNFPGTMIAESSLSFLGLGIQPPMVSLGRLLAEGRVYLLTSWWVTVIPGVIIFLATLSMTVIGDWIRDKLGNEQE